MAKPNIYIIQKSYLKKNEHGQLPGSYDIATTIGLVEYEKDGEKKYMLVDTCQTVHWKKIKQAILDIAGDLKNISHVLLTHLHKDHIQNIGQFDGAYLFSANKTTLLGTNEYGSREIYPDGYIEIPEIHYEIVNDAHSHDDTVYIIDSANEGKVAFLGDLIYTRLEKMPVEMLIGMEQRASIDPVKKFLYVKEFTNKYPDVQKVYVGHDDEPLSRDDIRMYVETLDGSSKWNEYLNSYIAGQKEKLSKQNKLLR